MPAGKYIRTPEIREKIRLARLGTKASLETRKKLSDAHKGKIPIYNTRPVSDETKIKLSITKGGRGYNWKTHNTKIRVLLSEKQNGLCKICGKPESGKRFKHLAIDHDHQTGKVRGLLCFKCNTLLGFIQDSEEILLKALEYLRSSENTGYIHVNGRVTKID